MKKYYLGLIVLVLLVVGLVGFTLYQGGLSKQDKVVQDRAVEIADSLNDYVDQKNKIPASLKEADIADAPDAISYSKLSDKKYRFCVTYKTASRGYSVGAWEIAWSSFMMSRFGFNASDDGYEPSELFINTFGHKKGQDCTTVKPMLRTNSTDTSESSLDDGFGSLCDPNGEYYSFYKEYCSGGSLLQ